jgi:hypothetical protein
MSRSKDAHGNLISRRDALRLAATAGVGAALSKYQKARSFSRMPASFGLTVHRLFGHDASIRRR